MLLVTQSQPGMVFHDLRSTSSVTSKTLAKWRSATHLLGQFYPDPDMQWCFVNSPSNNFGLVSKVVRTNLKRIGSGGKIYFYLYIAPIRVVCYILLRLGVNFSACEARKRECARVAAAKYIIPQLQAQEATATISGTNWILVLTHRSILYNPCVPMQRVYTQATY